MGLFSRDKDSQNPKKEEENVSKVPLALPDTVVDKIRSTSKSNSESQNLLKDPKKISSDFVGIKIPNKIEALSSEKIIVKQENVPDSSSENKNHDHMHHFDKSYFFDKFFGKHSKHHNIENMSSKDLVFKLREYHDSLKTGHNFFLHEEDIEDQISDKLYSLRVIESEWAAERKALDAAERMLLEKEKDIESRFNELKDLMSSASKYRLFHSRCPQDKVFILKNGQSLSSIQELLYCLPQMPIEVYKHHVTSERDDFYEWIQGVFHAQKLAEFIKFSRSKEDLIYRLKTF